MELQQIMDVSRFVYRELGQGHTEKTYQRGMQAVLNHRQIFHTTEAPIPISILGQVIGCGRCDILVGDYALELKANSSAPNRATGQLQKYLSGLLLRTGEAQRNYKGIVINFNQKQDTVDFLEVIPRTYESNSDFELLKGTNQTAGGQKTANPKLPTKNVHKPRTLMEEFLVLHLKAVPDANSLIPMCELKDSYERFIGCAMDMSIPEFQRKLRVVLRHTRTCSFANPQSNREVSYGSLNSKLPGLILLA
jgi:GxxExxY protein